MAFDLSETEVSGRGGDSVDSSNQGKKERPFHFEFSAEGSDQTNFGLGQSPSG